MCICVYQGNLGTIDTRVHKAEQYFTQTETDCSISSCPELLRKGKGPLFGITSYSDSSSPEVTQRSVTDLELMFPSAPTTSITVVTVTQSNGVCEEAAAQDKDQLLRKVSPQIT